MEYPFRYLQDAVELVYDEVAHEYLVSYQRTIENIGAEPLLSTSGQMLVCVFPDDLELAHHYSRQRPLRLADLHFEAADGAGAVLAHQLRYETDSYLAWQIHWRDAQTGRPLPVYPGETRTLRYRYRVSEELWGPYVERTLLVPCAQMTVALRFPPRLVEVWGEEYTGAGTQKPITPPLQVEQSARAECYSWSRPRPELLGKYLFHWHFKDERQLTFANRVREHLQQSRTADEQIAAHGPDFRSVQWFGTPYSFTPIQAACVAILWHAWERGTPEVGQDYILTQTSTKAVRVYDLFQHHPAWRTFIGRGERKGTLRLQPPTVQKNALGVKNFSPTPGLLTPPLH